MAGYVTPCGHRPGEAHCLSLVAYPSLVADNEDVEDQDAHQRHQETNRPDTKSKSKHSVVYSFANAIQWLFMSIGLLDQQHCYYLYQNEMTSLQT